MRPRWVVRLEPLRVALVVVAVGIAVLTARGGADPPAGMLEHLPGVYVAAALVAGVVPSAIAFQVVLGQALVAGAGLGGEGVPLSRLVALLVGVVLTAELLGIAARRTGALPREPGEDLRRAVGAALVGGAGFGVVSLVGRVQGPSGLWAVGIACAILVGLAALLVRRIEGS